MQQGQGSARPRQDEVARPPDRKKTRRQPAGFPGPAAGIHKLRYICSIEYLSTLCSFHVFVTGTLTI